MPTARCTSGTTRSRCCTFAWKKRSAKSTDIRQQEAEIFSEPYLLKRPLLNAITYEDQAPVLLIDEVDRADEEFEAFLLEVLSDFQVTIPELGTVRAKHRPYVVLTSNRTRELSDALKRRCLYLWIDYPDFDKEVRIIETKVEGINPHLAEQVAAFMQVVRRAAPVEDARHGRVARLGDEPDGAARRPPRA